MIKILANAVAEMLAAMSTTHAWVAVREEFDEEASLVVMLPGGSIQS